MIDRRHLLGSLAGTLAAPTAVLSQTGAARAPAVQVLGTAPVGSFFENLVFGQDGAMYLTNYTAREVLRYTPATGLQLHAQLDAHPLGLHFLRDGSLIVGAQPLNLFGGGGTMSNAGTLYRARPGGPLKRWKEVEGASFLNGMAQLSPTELLIADSRGGVLWRLDGTTGQTTPFVRDPLLDTADPASLTPAANGIKLYAGSVYVSNTARGLLLRIPLDGRQPGAVEVLAEKLRADDFAFSPDGRLHYTTHRDKIFVFENGRSVEFAGAEAGVVGNTALLWGPDGSGPYVTTDGGYVAQQWYRGPEAGPAQLLKFHG